MGWVMLNQTHPELGKIYMLMTSRDGLDRGTLLMPFESISTQSQIDKDEQLLVKCLIVSNNESKMIELTLMSHYWEGVIRRVNDQ